MKRRARFLSLLLGTLGAVGLAQPIPAAAAAIVTQSNVIIPVDPTPLTNACNGDSISFSGPLHIVLHTTIDDGNGNGTAGVHTFCHINYQEVKGVGIPSGIAYNLNGGSQIFHFNYRVNGSLPPPCDPSSQTDPTKCPPFVEFSQVLNIRVIGQGPRDNNVLHVVIHLRVNPNGVDDAPAGHLG